MTAKHHSPVSPSSKQENGLACKLIYQLWQWVFSYPVLLLLAACVGALGFALIAQFGLGLSPCPLCLMQRVPYALGILAMIAAFLGRARPGWVMAMLGVTAVALLANAVLAGYHAGVEVHWWGQTDAGCPISNASAELGSWKAMLEKWAPGRCDEVAWVIFGISAVIWNTLLSLSLSMYAGIALFRLRRLTDKEESL